MTIIEKNKELDKVIPVPDSSVFWKQPFPDYLESPAPPKRSKQERSRKYRLLIFLLFTILLSYAAWMYYRESLDSSLENFLLILILMIVSHFLVFSINKSAPKALLRTSDDPRQLVLESENPPLLLLRPFSFDNKIPGMAQVTIENILAETCLRIDTCLIGLGRKSQIFFGEGSARFHVEDDMWKTGLLELLKRSQAVFVLVGYTPNLEWELDQLYNHEDTPDEIFFIFPSTSLMPSKYKQNQFNKIDSLGPWKKHMPSMIISRSKTNIILFNKKKYCGLKQMSYFKLTCDRFIEILSEYDREKELD